MDDNTNISTQENLISESHSSEKKKPYNGYLRNSNRNPQKEVMQNKKKPSFHKKTKNFQSNSNHIHSEQFIEENTDTSQPVNKIKDLISYIRQKSGFNPVRFWQELDKILLEKPFSELNDNDTNILSYIIIYSKDNVYKDLLEKFTQSVPQEIFEKNIYNYCINKNSSFLQNSLEYYDKYYQPSNYFLNTMIEKFCKASYRTDNNQIFLSWLDNKISDEQKKLFWEKCIDERNVVLCEHALHFPNLHHYLKSNYSEFETKINNLGKKHTTEKALGIFNNQITEPVEILETISVSQPIEINTEFLDPIKMVESNLPKLKESIKTEVIVKKKRKIL